MGKKSFRYLSVCSGIEAFSVAVHALDFKPVAFAEIDDFPNKVLAYRFPGVRNLGDFTVADTKTLGRIDWLVGGTPCQSFSVAGQWRFGSKGAGLDVGDLSPTLRASGHDASHSNGGAPPAVHSGPQVRRLTPEECEKLQGYPVGWTRIPGLSGWRAVAADEDVEWLRSHGHDVRVSKKTGKARVNDPDGPRYKALGNSFTTEPVNWIMCRVQASMRGLPMPDWQPMRLWAKPGWQMPKK